MIAPPSFWKLAAVLGVAGSGLLSTLAHAEFVVISNLTTPIPANEIKEVFTGEKQFSGSTKLVPVDNGPIQEEFLSTALRMNAARYNTIWTKKSFREGLPPPSVKSGDREVTDFVRRTPGAIGYVTSLPSGVNVVHRY